MLSVFSKGEWRELWHQEKKRPYDEEHNPGRAEGFFILVYPSQSGPWFMMRAAVCCLLTYSPSQQKKHKSDLSDLITHPLVCLNCRLNTWSVLDKIIHWEWIRRNGYRSSHFSIITGYFCENKMCLQCFALMLFSI